MPAQKSARTRSHLVERALERPGDDPIFALNGEAMRRAAQGEDVVNATLGALFLDDGKLATLPTLFESLHAVPDTVAASYAPIAGPKGFLQSVIDDLLGGTPLAEHAVAAATPGGTGACYAAIVNFLDPGEALLTTGFYWSPYAILSEHARRGLATFRMFREDGGFDLEALERALELQLTDQGRALVVLNTPCHNPTGFSLDADEWRGLTELLLRAEERGPVALLLDLAYEKFGARDAPDWRPHLEPLVGKVQLLFAWTASKAFTLYGGRVGALVAVHPDPDERERLFNAISYTCRGTWSNCNHLGMEAVGRVLADPDARSRADREREGLRDLLDERVRAFNAEAAKHELPIPRYEGGFFVTVFTPDAADVVLRAKAKGVFLVPLQNAVRVALCSTRADQVPRLAATLAEALRA